MRATAGTLLLAAGVATAVPVSSMPAPDQVAIMSRRAAPQTVEVSNLVDSPMVAGYMAAQSQEQEAAEQQQPEGLASEFRIVNGFEATSDFPWMASLNIVRIYS